MNSKRQQGVFQFSNTEKLSPDLKFIDTLVYFQIQNLLIIWRYIKTKSFLVDILLFLKMDCHYNEKQHFDYTWEFKGIGRREF